MSEEIVNQIKKEDYGHKNKFKLNVRVHNMFVVKYQILCNFLIKDLIELTSKDQAYLVYQEVILKLFEKTGL